jgi:hypothetical protein
MDKLKKLAGEELEEATSEELEKALDVALEDLSKADKKKKKVVKKDFDEDENEEDDEEFDEDEDDEEEEEYQKSGEPEYEALSKSIEDSLNSDPDSSDVLEVTPFLKSLVRRLDDQITDLTKAMVYQAEEIKDLRKSLRKKEGMEVAQAKLVKSISTRMEAIGGTVLPRKSLLGDKIQIMRKSIEGGEERASLTKSEALSKLPKLVNEGKISIQDSIKFESRIQKGIPLPNDVMTLM